MSMGRKKHIAFEVTALRFNVWDSPEVIFEPPEGQPRKAWYTTSIPHQDVPDELATMIPVALEFAERSSMGLLSLRSKNKPFVCGMDPHNRDLIELRRKCQDVNVSMQRLIREVRAEVCVDLWDKTSRSSVRTDPYGLSLVAVRFDAASVKVPTWDSVMSGEPY